ncbi:TPA: hypothetical protein DIV55_04470 [Patescibacteria group bacterium]|uniref:Uncharacterized protein n=1 Tax=Candidatus Gottesmanbacteria bacterium GW2011_GWA1_43_11 TaxID=1618436 RepID=A0A0G1CF08_9BACT|nr:MAG: hypothetical protein UV59_C0020G0029 [Candidatus Gottesmanbacteria bacterium GW2011_GWA1_43_11]HCS78968.1 hypothetical protein [Patescibacteria group bacterium]
MLGKQYYWVARYFDGTSLKQIDSSGIKHAYKDIDRDKLAAFEIWEGNSRILFIRFKKGQRLIWRRRVETSPGGIIEVCHIIGKQETIGGKNYQGIIGLFESDGRIEIAGKFEEGHPWFFPVKIHTEEGEQWE